MHREFSYVSSGPAAFLSGQAESSSADIEHKCKESFSRDPSNTSILTRSGDVNVLK